MNEQLNRVEEKVDKVHDKIEQINITLAKNTESLVHHVKRTDLLEQRLVPIENHITSVVGFFTILKWSLGILATVVSIGTAIYKLWF